MAEDRNQHEHSRNCTHQLSCCLKKEPTPLSDKIQRLRKDISKARKDNIEVNSGEIIQITDDMIIGDVINVFPVVKSFFEEANPLGLKSISINQESIALFLTGTGIDSKKLCNEINLFLKSQ